MTLPCSLPGPCSSSCLIVPKVCQSEMWAAPGAHKAAFESYTPILGKGEGADIAVPIQHMLIVLVPTLKPARPIAEQGAGYGSRYLALNILNPIIEFKSLGLEGRSPVTSLHSKVFCRGFQHHGGHSLQFDRRSSTRRYYRRLTQEYVELHPYDAMWPYVSPKDARSTSGKCQACSTEPQPLRTCYCHSPVQ